LNDTTAEYSESPSDTPPEVPDFELIRPIGRGGFGEVWLARNRATGLLRAVKVIDLRETGTADPAGREITSITRLETNVRTQHPNLLTIHHVGKTDDHLFYVMDPADDASGGRASAQATYQPATLQQRLEAGPLPLEECLQSARELLTGLAHLHGAGMVHRDVKPANCLFVGGQLRLGDFGLLVEAGPQVSRVGTQKYMPPDGRMDTRADVFAAGLVIYEMLTGLPAESFPRLGQRAGAIGDDETLQRLNRLALRACQPDPALRFQNAEEMLAELDLIKAGESGPPAGRRRLVFSTAALLICAAALWVMLLCLNLPKLASVPEPVRVKVNFITHPFEATILLNGAPLKTPDGQLYRTPCTVPDLVAGPHHVVFHHPDRGELDAGEINFSSCREIEASWD
jgi:serine/threonine protein kinase